MILNHLLFILLTIKFNKRIIWIIVHYHTGQERGRKKQIFLKVLIWLVSLVLMACFYQIDNQIKGRTLMETEIFVVFKCISRTS